MPLSTRLQKKKQKSKPVWRGPAIDGITFSLLSRFLVCRERFRLLVVEGLRPVDTFNHRIEYGQMWHLCEETYLATESIDSSFERLKTYTVSLCHKYPTAQEQIEHWYQVCMVQFPLYIEYWKTHPDIINCKPISQEQTFDIPYALPTGRIVRLRGKLDALQLIGPQIYLQENKTRGQIIPDQIQRQLSFDLQTMLYLVALQSPKFRLPADLGYPIAGVIYNVVRRPLSGGKGSIVRHKATKNQPEETKDSFYGRVKNIIGSFPQEYFMRWKVEITKGDIDRFKHDCLDPLLEQLCIWWDDVSRSADPFSARHNHWRHPFGVMNVLDEGGSSDLDEYLSSGSTVGLQRVNKLFTELEA